MRSQLQSTPSAMKSVSTWTQHLTFHYKCPVNFRVLSCYLGKPRYFIIPSLPSRIYFPKFTKPRKARQIDLKYLNTFEERINRRCVTIVHSRGHIRGGWSRVITILVHRRWKKYTAQGQLFHAHVDLRKVETEQYSCNDALGLCKN